MMKISQVVGLSYVDDCDMLKLDDDIEATHLQMQLAISEWGDLIRIMGGWLEPGKSAWYIVDYE